jgi:ABC-type transport system involved in cytochrome c biogenesis ATPase subunit
MAKLQKLTYRGWDGQERVLDFLGTMHPREGVHATVITGQNGSHKSTILRELVAALVVPDYKGTLTRSSDSTPAEGPRTVICASGSVADRFPPKESGGRRTEFDVPNYIYIGQRVGTNLLSKKLPLETAVAFALNASGHERFLWPFYGKAHKLAGIIPRIDLEFKLRTTSKRDKKSSITLLDFVQKRAQGQELVKGQWHGMSQANAVRLTEQFSYDDFTDLDYVLSNKGREPIRIALNDRDQFVSSALSPEAIRLGLLAGELVLADAQVFSRHGGKSFSIYDLSSGEYHLLTTILALGFSLEDGAIVLIDEPENSLHPQWQQEFMQTLFEMCAFMKDGHVVISTHSPLIVSSAPEGSTVVDLSNTAEALQATGFAFGASADEILFEQFGIASSRNPVVVEIIQQAVDLAERELTGSLEFTSMTKRLKYVREHLRSGDPLKDVIDALLEGAG